MINHSRSGADRAPATRNVALTACLLIASAASAQIESEPEFRTYPISNIAVDDAAQRIRSMLQAAGDQSQVLVDRSQNRLLVQGSPSTQDLAAQLLQGIDQPLRIAQQDSRTPKAYPVPPAHLERVVAQLRKEFPEGRGVRIATDPRTSQIIVVAGEATQKQIAQRVNLLAAAIASQANDHRAAAAPYALRNISWRELETGLHRVSRGSLQVATEQNGELATYALQTPTGPQTVLQVDRRLQQVSFHGSLATTTTWRKAVEILDQPKSAEDDQMEVVPLGSNANSVRVQRAVAALADGKPVDGSVTALDTDPQWGGRLVSRIFQQASQPQPGGEPAAEGGLGGLIGSVQIEYLEGLDVIIIRGRPQDVAQVQKIIDEIMELAEVTQPVVEVYRLQHVNGAAVATLVDELYDEILSARQGPVSIRALVDPNAVLLIGRQDSVEVVKDLINKLDQPSHPTSQFQVFRLKHVSAVDAEQTIRNFFVNRPGIDTDPRLGIGTQVRVLADYRSNSLIVQASPRDLSEVKRLLENIDINDTDNAAQIRVFPLQNALAEDLAETLQTAITGPTDGGGQGAGGQQGATQTQSSIPSATLQFVDREGGQLLRSGILSDALVTAEPNTNALVVRAPADSMELFAALIAQLDKLPDAEAQIKVFTIENGDATSLAGMLQQLFGQQVTIGQGNAQFALGGLGQQALQGATAGGETSLVPLRFAVDVRTNSIIASASEPDLRVVEAIIVRLDESDVETRRLKVVRLKNAPAESVANSITSFLQSQRQLIQQQLLFNQAISPFEQIEREVIVVPELVTNSLIVSATPRYFDEILQVVSDLDFRPKMVMVQVVIAEIVLSDEFEFGVEFGLQDSLLFDRGITLDAMGNLPPNAQSIPGFNFNNLGQTLPNVNSVGRNLLASQGLTNFGVGRTNGGLVLSAANESINILVRALQEQGQAQILARPQVMTLNNQQAFVQVGQNVARITGTTITNGIVQNNINDVETGLILSITPLINDDGVVVMSIDAERSALGSEAEGTIVGFDQTGNAIRSPPIDLTTASTVISAKSGQTVAFAGLITSDKTSVYRRVPWLADIPVVGRLFEFEDSLDRRTELLIIMTPHIVEADEDYEWIKAMESDRMSWCLEDIVNIHGDVGLQGNNPLFCCDPLPVIYPHSNPMGIETISAPVDSLGPPPHLMNREGVPAQPSPVVTQAPRNPQGPDYRQTTGVTPQLPGSYPNPNPYPYPQSDPRAGAPPQPSDVNSGYRTTVTYGPPPGPRARLATPQNVPSGVRQAAGNFGGTQRLPQTRR